MGIIATVEATCDGCGEPLNLEQLYVVYGMNRNDPANHNFDTATHAFHPACWGTLNGQTLARVLGLKAYYAQGRTRQNRAWDNRTTPSGHLYPLKDRREGTRADVQRMAAGW